MMTLVLAAALATAAFPPTTPKRPVTDTYFGQRVVDEYRWLESWDDPKVQAWSEAQNAHARAVLDALPGRAVVEQRVTELLSFESPAWFALTVERGRLFAMKQQPPKQQSFLVAMPVPGGAGKGDEVTIVDPNVLDPTGGTSIDWYLPSKDGKLVAVSLSAGGTESGDVHVFETATGKERTGDVVPRANSGTAGGGLAWKKDGTGFWYTRHPAPGERAPEDAGFFQQVWFHELGTKTAQDVYAVGKEFPRTAESFMESSDDGRFVVDLVQLGDGGQFELFLLDVKKKAWTRVAGYDDKIVQAAFAPDGALWLVSKQGAPRGRVLRLAPATPSLTKAQVVVPEGEATIDSIQPTKSRLYVTEQLGGPSRVRVLDTAGKELATLPVPPVSTVGGVTRIGDGDDVLFSVQSYVQPLAWYRLAAKDGAVTKTSLAQQSPVSFDDVDVVRIEAVSKDGTKVPVNVLMKKGTKQDGKNPTLLTGYGGFSIPMTPRFNKLVHAWIEQGGVYAVANLRGGSEFGEAWHEQGAKTKKQNVFDDFIAAGEALVAQKYTQPAKLAIQGGSNGGLLMGAALTQRPELWKAVVAQVGYFDMLRYETRPNGAFNNTEYGSVQNEAEFQALRAYSPYHRVVDKQPYPPMLCLTGANDPRVDPLHSRKMVARLQAAGARALLRTSAGTGHGGGTPLKAKIAENVDVYAFLFNELGVTLR